MEFEVASHILIFLMGAAFVAGFVDSIAGGGGLITLPAMILGGADPITALATNKVQGLFGAGTAAANYARAGLVDPRRQWKAGLAAFAAALVGAMLAGNLPTGVIRMGLPFLLIAIALFFALKPGLSDKDSTARMPLVVFGATFVPLIGFYDGLIGPGTGAFLMMGFVTLAGYGVLKATAHTKFLNFASNVGGMTGFAMVASPWWMTGVAMGLAQMAGAALGARLAVRVGARIIKPVLVVSSTALALKLLWDAYA